MIIKQNIKQLIRSPIMSILLIILLSLSSVFMFLSIATWITSEKSISASQDAFTSIAVVSENSFKKEGQISDEEKRSLYDSLKGIYEVAGNSEYTKLVDIRKPVMAYCENLKTVTSAMYDLYGDDMYKNFPYNNSVIIGTVESIKYEHGGKRVEGYDGKTIQELVYIGCTVIVKIDRKNSPVLVADYPYERIKVQVRKFGNDLNEFFKIGEKCIIYGNLSYPSRKSADDYIPYFYMSDVSSVDHGRVFLPDQYDLVKVDENILNMLGINSETKIGKEKITDCYIPQWKDQTDIQYSRIEGSIKDFLSSDKGARWNYIINECNITTKSLMMRFTDCLDSILLFNQHQARIIKGRTFTQQEYRDGSKVCIISSEIAEYNGINVGDRIDFSFWHNGFRLNSSKVWTIWHPEPFVTDCGFLEENTYEVVGIYSSENAWEIGDIYFTPNTAFAPNSSMNVQYDLIMPTMYIVRNFSEEGEVFDTEVLQHISAPNMRSYILKNGHIDEFEEEMESYGYGDIFSYYDQGYSMIEPILNIFKDSSLKIMYISIAVWIVMIIVFLSISWSRNRKSIRTMVTLGTGRKKVFLNMITSIILITLIVSIISTAAGYMLYDRVIDDIYNEAKETSANMEYSDFKTEMSLSGSYDISVIEKFDLTKTPDVIAQIAVIQFVSVMIVTCSFSVYISRKEPVYFTNSKTFGKRRKQ